MVLISTSSDEALAYVLEYEDDIEEIQSTLGVAAFDDWGVFINGAPSPVEDEDECVQRQIRLFAAGFNQFPGNEIFSRTTRGILANCLKGFATLSPDKALVKAYTVEYEVFQAVERQVCGNQVSGRLFRNINDFLSLASSIMNRRKSRAGRSLENHVETLLKIAGVRHEMRPNLGSYGTPDIVIPSAQAYFDHDYPVDRLMIVGLKTTCKDRWRQVTQEGPRVRQKHLLTLQRGVSGKQLLQMAAANVTLVVPAPLHELYPEGAENLLTVKDFIKAAKAATG